MKIRDRIIILTNVKNAIINKLIPIDTELLSRLEAIGVHLDGCKGYKRNVPIEEKVLTMSKPQTLDPNEKAA